MKMICKLGAVAASLCLASSAFAYDMFSSPPPPPSSTSKSSGPSIKSPEYFAEQMRAKAKAKKEAYTREREQNAKRYQSQVEESRQARADNRPATTSQTTQTYTPAEQQRAARTHPYYQQQQAEQAPPTETPPTQNPYGVGNFGKPAKSESQDSSAGSWGISY